jgi:murein DD-endopeptidase MepM/ murein hydrolase activator NlpD
VDIANRCGTPVVAAADGIVVADATYGEYLSGRNGGYGLLVLLS